MKDLSFRPALPGDAEALVDIVMMAGEGLPDMAWAGMAEPGQTARDVGLQRAARESGSFSYRNALLAERGGRVLGGMVGYALPEEAVEIGPDFPPEFVPLQELENLAPKTWYLNILGVYPDLRGQGIGGAFLERAGEMAREDGLDGVSIIAFAANEGAVRLYRRSGFDEKARRPMSVPGWEFDGTDAILLIRR
ncbi:GNAT family N-acetyltransferase [Pseudoruegeria sp. HB172150]|uniref:GNAT family N-acetyltransferase n=1 Tax=Pseudoruegeria sp. HB172150 TaxID=2721164 RepID=UPI0015552698|nr:GNAT family N-acetyltransferase [Pseudoruegeria sp. HB172150]